MILPLENQICSLESSKRLKQLRFKQNSLFYWVKGRMNCGYEGEWSIDESEEYFLFDERVGLKPGKDCFNIEWPINVDDHTWEEVQIKQKRRAKYVYSAYTVAELGELLKNYKYCNIEYYGTAFKESLPEWSKDTSHWCAYKGGGGIANDVNEAEARAKMLIYLADNDLIQLSK